jgi:hypothetical protein
VDRADPGHDEAASPRLEENIGAVNVVLSTDDLAHLDQALAKIEIQGERYPEELEKRTGL